MNALTDFERGWLVGLIEGEGCFSWNGGGERRKNGTYRRYPRFVLRMTDQDVVEKAHQMTGLGVVKDRPGRKAHWKHLWIWQVTGTQKVFLLAKVVFPGLGARRQEKLRELFPDHFGGGDDW